MADDEEQGQLGFLINVDLKTDQAEKKLETLAANIERKLKEAMNASAATIGSTTRKLDRATQNLSGASKGANNQTSKVAVPDIKIDTAAMEHKLDAMNVTMRDMLAQMKRIASGQSGSPLPSPRTAARPSHHFHSPVHRKQVAVGGEASLVRTNLRSPAQGYMTVEEQRALAQLRQMARRGATSATVRDIFGSNTPKARGKKGAPFTPAFERALSQLNVIPKQIKEGSAPFYSKATKSNVDAFDILEGAPEAFNQHFKSLYQQYHNRPRVKFAQRHRMTALNGIRSTRGLGPGGMMDMGGMNQIALMMQQMQMTLNSRLEAVQAKLREAETQIALAEARSAQAANIAHGPMARRPVRVNPATIRRHHQQQPGASATGGFPSWLTSGALLGFTENTEMPVWALITSLLNSEMPKRAMKTIQSTAKKKGSLAGLQALFSAMGLGSATSTNSSAPTTAPLETRLTTLNETLLALNSSVKSLTRKLGTLNTSTQAATEETAKTASKSKKKSPPKGKTKKGAKQSAAAATTAEEALVAGGALSTAEHKAAYERGVKKALARIAQDAAYQKTTTTALTQEQANKLITAAGGQQPNTASQKSAQILQKRRAKLQARGRMLKASWNQGYGGALSNNEAFFASNPEAQVLITPFKHLRVNPVTNKTYMDTRNLVSQRGANGALSHQVLNAARITPQMQALSDTALQSSRVASVKAYMEEILKQQGSGAIGLRQNVNTGSLQQTVAITSNGVQVMDAMDKSTHDLFSYIDRHMAMWALLSVGIYGVADAFKHASEDVARFQLEMARIQQMGTGVPYLQTFNGLMNIATQYGESVSSASQVMAQFVAMGYPTSTAMNLTNQAMLASNISGMTPHESSQAIISSQYQFGLSASQIPQLVNTWASVFQHSGIPIAQITEGNSIAGEAVANLNMNNPKITPMQSAAESAAMVAEATRATGLTANQSSQTLKYILNNLDTTKTNEILAQFGIGQYNAKTGNPLGAYQMMSNLSTWMNNPHTSAASAEILTRALTGYGGRRAAQAELVIKNFNSMMNGGLMASALTPGNSAATQNQIIMNTLVKSIDQVDKAFEHLTISLASPVLLQGITYLAKGITGIVQALSGTGFGGALGQALSYTGLAAGGMMAYRFARNMPTVNKLIGAARETFGNATSGLRTAYQYGSGVSYSQALRNSLASSGMMGATARTSALDAQKAAAAAAARAAAADKAISATQDMATAPGALMATARAGSAAGQDVPLIFGGVAAADTVGTAAASTGFVAALGGMTAALGPAIIAIGAMTAGLYLFNKVIQAIENRKANITAGTQAMNALAFQVDHRPGGTAQFRSQYNQLRHLNSLSHLTAAQTEQQSALTKALTVTLHTPASVSNAYQVGRFGATPTYHSSRYTQNLAKLPYAQALRIVRSHHLSHSTLQQLQAIQENSITAPSTKLASAYQTEFNTALQAGQAIVSAFASTLQMTQAAFLDATQSVGYFATTIKGLLQEMQATSTTTAISAPFLALEGQNYNQVMGATQNWIKKHGARNFVKSVVAIEKAGPSSQQGYLNESYNLYTALQTAAPAYFSGLQQLQQLSASLGSMYQQILQMQAALVEATTDMQMFTLQVGQLSAIAQMASGKQQALIPSPNTFGAQIAYGTQSFGSNLTQMALAQAQLGTVQAVMQKLGVNKMSANQLANPTTWQQVAGAGLVQQQEQLQQSIGQLAPQITQQYEGLINLTLSAQGYEGVWQDILNTFSAAQNALAAMQTTQDQLIANATSNALNEQFFGSQFNVGQAMFQQASSGRSSYANIATQIAQTIAQYGTNMQKVMAAVNTITNPNGQLSEFVASMNAQVVAPEQAIAEMNQSTANSQIKAAQAQYSAAVEQVKAANLQAQNSGNFSQILNQFAQYMSQINPQATNPKNYNGQKVPYSVSGGSLGVGATQKSVNSGFLTGQFNRLKLGLMPGLGNYLTGIRKQGGSMSQAINGLGYYVNSNTPIYAGTSVTAWAPLIAALSKQYGIDPNIVAAVISQESSGNAFAVSQHGYGVGLMQIDARSHSNYFKSTSNPFAPVANISEGIKILLSDYQKAGGNWTKALDRYNGSSSYGPKVMGLVNSIKKNGAIQSAFAAGGNLTSAQLSQLTVPGNINMSTSSLSMGQILSQLTGQQNAQMQVQYLQNAQVQALLGGNVPLYEQIGTYVQKAGGTAITNAISPTSTQGRAILAHNQLLSLNAQLGTAQSLGNTTQVQDLQIQIKALMNYLKQLGFGKYGNLSQYSSQMGFNTGGMLSNTPSGAEAIASVNAELQNLLSQAMALPSTMQGLQISLKGSAQAFMSFGDWSDFASNEISALNTAISTLQQDLQQGLINPADIPSVQQAIQSLQIESFSTQLGQSFASSLSSGISNALQGNITAPTSFMNSFKQAVANQIGNVMSSEMMSSGPMQQLMSQLGLGMGSSLYNSTSPGSTVYQNLVNGTNYFVQQVKALFGQGSGSSTKSLQQSTTRLAGSANYLATAAQDWNTNNITSLLVQAQNQGFALINQLYSLFGPVLAQIGNNTYNAPQGFKVSPFLYQYSSSAQWAPIPGSGLTPSLGFVGGTTNAQGSTVFYGAPGIGGANNPITAALSSSGASSSSSIGSALSALTGSTGGTSDLSVNTQALSSNTQSLQTLTQTLSQLMGGSPSSTTTTTSSVGSPNANVVTHATQVTTKHTSGAVHTVVHHTTVINPNATGLHVAPQPGVTVHIHNPTSDTTTLKKQVTEAVNTALATYEKKLGLKRLQVGGRIYG